MRISLVMIPVLAAMTHCAPSAPPSSDALPEASTDSEPPSSADDGGLAEASAPRGSDGGAGAGGNAADGGRGANQGDAGRAEAGDAAPPIAPSPYVPAGYTLVLSDEFNGATLDTGRWMTQYPCGCTKLNDEIEHYTNDGSNLHLKNGTIVIEADPDLSSGVFTGQASFRHGYFELRAQMGVSQGAWPAYWLTSDTRWPPEWDIFEVVSTPANVYQTPHPVSGDTATCQVSNNEISGLIDVNTGFHIYGFLWTETDITWWIDGMQTQHCTVDAASSDDFMWIQHNLAIGGSWPGNPDGTTVWPLTLAIDYSRVYQDPSGQISMHNASGDLVDPESPR